MSGASPRSYRLPGAPALFGFPFDGATDRRNLLRGPDAGRGDRAHRLDELPARARRRRRGATLIQASAIPELGRGVVAEEIGGAGGAIGARHRLVLVMKVGKR